MIEKNCKNCHKKFKVHKYRANSAKTCSNFCRQKYHSIIMVEVLSKKPKKKWISGNGYAYIYVDGKAVLEHRHVVEKALNVRLSSDQAVHHKNHIRTDNRIENLEVCDRGEHARVHIMEVKPWGK